MPRWNIQYVYKDVDGKTRISITQVVALTEDRARQEAAKIAPTPDSVISIQVETEEQVLGAVRREALRLAGRSVSSFSKADNDEPDDSNTGGG